MAGGIALDRRLPQATVGLTATQDVVLTNVGTSGSLTLSSTAISGPDARCSPIASTTPAAGGAGTGRVDHRDGRLPPVGDGRALGDSVRRPLGGGHPVGRAPLGHRRLAPGGGTGPSFGKSLLSGASIGAPTSLQFGPDGRLYVAQMDGTIRAFTVERGRSNQYRVTATETITLVRSIPNRNDDGVEPLGDHPARDRDRGDRHGPEPEIYVVSSDPRIGAGTRGPISTSTRTPGSSRA